MKQVETDPTIAEKIQELLQHLTVESAFADYCDNSETNKSDWKPIIEEQLSEWLLDVSQFDDDGLEPPSPKSVHTAFDAACAFRDLGLPPPARVCPNGDGGISFERKVGTVLDTIGIDEDGTVEWYVFRNSRLVCRKNLAMNGGTHGPI